MSSNNANMPVRKTMCATCPFRPGSKYAALAPSLGQSALSEASRICHSTGANNGINKRTGFPPHLCRGARELQLEFFAGVGIISEPTDEAWNAARVRLGMKPQTIKNPTRKDAKNVSIIKKTR